MTEKAKRQRQHEQDPMVRRTNFDAVESNIGAMQILEDIKTVVSFFKKASTPIANISTRAYNNYINDKGSVEQNLFHRPFIIYIL